MRGLRGIAVVVGIIGLVVGLGVVVDRHGGLSPSPRPVGALNLL